MTLTKSTIPCIMHGCKDTQVHPFPRCIKHQNAFWASIREAMRRTDQPVSLSEFSSAQRAAMLARLSRHV